VRPPCWKISPLASPAQGLSHRIGLADTYGAAWALARHGKGTNPAPIPAERSEAKAPQRVLPLVGKRTLSSDLGAPLAGPPPSASHHNARLHQPALTIALKTGRAILKQKHTSFWGITAYGGLHA